MKNFKIAVATAALALASGYAVAQNTDTATTSADFHLSQPIQVSATSLQFPHLVMPTSTSTDTYVTVSNTGTVTYGNPSTSGAPGSTNATNANVTSTAAKLTITGEQSYQFSITASYTNPANITLDLNTILGASSGTSTSGTTVTNVPLGNGTIGTGTSANNTAAGTNGTAIVSLGGKLTAEDMITSSIPTTIALTFTVAYN